jgi:hypothetical protein
MKIEIYLNKKLTAIIMSLRASVKNRTVGLGGTYIFQDEVVLVSALNIGVGKRLRLLVLLCFHFSLLKYCRLNVFFVGFLVVLKLPQKII